MVCHSNLAMDHYTVGGLFMYTAKDRKGILKRGWIKGGKMFKQPEMTEGEIFLPEFQLTGFLLLGSSKQRKH